jgi:regulator of replication initiation timing
MTRNQSSEKLVETLLQTINPTEIAEESLRQTVEILLNLIEQLHTQVKELREQNQRLRDENSRLKGEQGQPDIKAKKPRGFSNNHSSEEERKTPKNHSKGSKNAHLKIDREEILEYPLELLPADAQFKGYEEVIVQDITCRVLRYLTAIRRYLTEVIACET